jgi:phenylacetate-CoA ligase
VTREGHLDAVTVKVELRPESATDEHAATACSVLRHRIKSLIGISCEVKAGPPGCVPRSQGKAQRVLDRRT